MFTGSAWCQNTCQPQWKPMFLKSSVDLNPVLIVGMNAQWVSSTHLCKQKSGRAKKKIQNKTWLDVKSFCWPSQDYSVPSIGLGHSTQEEILNSQVWIASKFKGFKPSIIGCYVEPYCTNPVGLTAKSVEELLFALLGSWTFSERVKCSQQPYRSSFH